MCRLAAYIGPAISLRKFLLEPPHSLYRQAREPQELLYTTLNADGYGFGWYSPGGTPSTYTNVLPIWSDSNLPSLARTLYGRLWIAEVRSATEGNPVHQFNTQPFSDSALLFVHNGFIQDFHEQVRHGILQQLAPAVTASIHGNTDSEYLFACLRQVMLDNPQVQLPAAISRLFELLRGLVGDRPALLNLVVTDGACLYATRHGLNHESPSLYYTTSDPRYPDGQLVASERFSTHPSWQPVPEHHILALTPDRPPELQPI
mgnify:CR=1 FL=1